MLLSQAELPDRPRSCTYPQGFRLVGARACPGSPTHSGVRWSLSVPFHGPLQTSWSNGELMVVHQHLKIQSALDQPKSGPVGLMGSALSVVSYLSDQFLMVPHSQSHWCTDGQIPVRRPVPPVCAVHTSARTVKVLIKMQLFSASLLLLFFMWCLTVG